MRGVLQHVTVAACALSLWFLLGGMAVAAPAVGASGVGSATSPSDQEKGKVVVYSFHGTLRCQTCLLVEENAEEAVRQGFSSELQGGSLAWRSVNVRLPENVHFATEFGVRSWALVLARYAGDATGEWKALTLAGELVRANPDVFRRYVEAEVRAFLGDVAKTIGDGK